MISPEHHRQIWRHRSTQYRAMRHLDSNCYMDRQSSGLGDKDLMDISSIEGSWRCLSLGTSIEEYGLPSRYGCWNLTKVDRAWSIQWRLRQKNWKRLETYSKLTYRYLPGITNAANPRIFFNPVIPKMNGKKRRSFSLKSFKMISIGMNIFLILCLTGNWREYYKVDLLLRKLITYKAAELSCLQWHRAHRKSHR